MKSDCNPILITGSSGLIGSEVMSYFAANGKRVHGIDNNQREVFFGAGGSTRWNQQRLINDFSMFTHHELDIRDRDGVLGLIQSLRPAAIVASGT